jgi:7,8-dihydropterin-6-yl-methyl-4-(beta-D-ribofuranosyl)aminobenzene 5'-phosphate synthase
MALKITTLVENSQGEHLGLKTEHGLSFFIEKDGHTLLFDTGQSGIFIENARQLRINLADLEYVVLSHGHYDHSGGLRSLSERAKKFELLLGEGFFNEKYGYYNNAYEYLGNNFDETFLAERGIPYRSVSEDVEELIPGFFVITNFPRIHEDEVINPRFRVLKDGSFQPDRFDDEVMIAIETEKGLVALLGCSHPGMRNMLDFAEKKLGKAIYAVLGGTHLVESAKDSRARSLDYFKEKNIEVVGVSHCTGKEAMELLKNTNSHFFQNWTGRSLIVS